MKEGDVVLTPLPQANGVVKTGRLSLCAECHRLETGLSAVSARNCASEWLNWMSQDGGFSYSSRFSRCDANCKIPRCRWLDLRPTQSASFSEGFRIICERGKLLRYSYIFRPQFRPVSFSLLFSSFPEDPSYPSRGRGTRGFPNPDSTFQLRNLSRAQARFKDGEAIRGCPNPDLTL